MNLFASQVSSQVSAAFQAAGSLPEQLLLGGSLLFLSAAALFFTGLALWLFFALLPAMIADGLNQLSQFQSEFRFPQSKLQPRPVLWHRNRAPIRAEGRSVSTNGRLEGGRRGRPHPVASPAFPTRSGLIRQGFTPFEIERMEQMESHKHLHLVAPELPQVFSRQPVASAKSQSQAQIARIAQ